MLVADYPNIEYSADMGLTHADFFRYLPSAMGEHTFRVEGNTVYGDVFDGTVEIRIGEAKVRRIALLEIPYSHVSFVFRGVSPEQQQQFKTHFDLRFQRGGG